MFPSGFTIYRKDRTGKKGGGVFIAVLNELSSFLEPELATDCEILWVRIQEKGRRSILVSSFYHPHTSSRKHEKLPRIGSPCHNAPKFKNNYRWRLQSPRLGLEDRTPKRNKSTKYPHGIQGWKRQHGTMVQETMRGPNTLDLFLTNQPSLVARVETTPGLSDHCAVYMEMQLNPPKTGICMVYVRIYAWCQPVCQSSE